MTSSSTADHDKRLGKRANHSVMVGYGCKQSENVLLRCVIDARLNLTSVCMCQGTMGCQKTCKVEKLLKQSQWEVTWSQKQRFATIKKNNRARGTDKVSVVRRPPVCGAVKLSLNKLWFVRVWTLSGSALVDACSNNLTAACTPQPRLSTVTKAQH